MRQRLETETEETDRVLRQRQSLSLRFLSLSNSSVFRSYKRTNGFTLIELLTVISIIGIITTVITVNLSSARKQARDVRRKTDIGTIQSAVELFANASGGKVPAAAAPLKSSNAAPWILGLDLYLSNVPIDPTNSGDNVYTYQTGALGSKYQNNYIVEAVLEAEAKENANLANVSTDPNDPKFYVTGSYWDDAKKQMHYRVSSGQ